MRKAVVLIMILTFGAVLPLASSGQEMHSLPINVTLKVYEEVKVSVDSNNVKRVNITLTNQHNEVSTVWWASFYQGKERSETEIGAKQYRTHDLQPKIAGEGGAHRPDKKVIVLNVEKTDAILIHVGKGEVLVHMSKESPSI